MSRFARGTGSRFAPFHGESLMSGNLRVTLDRLYSLRQASENRRCMDQGGHCHAPVSPVGRLRTWMPPKRDVTVVTGGDSASEIIIPNLGASATSGRIAALPGRK